ncbi:MAG: MraY family glycosyltransferase [Sulfuricurvum sp.]|nr:MraY family glycosyltransferase [Sulfuricurvum sp.]
MEKRYGFFIDPNTKAHAIHKTPTPRVGGIGIFLSFFISVFIFMPDFWWLAISSAIIFGFGLYEDWHGNTPKQYRLGAMAIATYIAVYYGGYIANNMEFFVLPYFVAVALTVFAVVGMSSAINFVDGLNGLASGISIVVLIFYAMLSFMYDGRVIFPLSMILVASVLAFFVWNYPKGNIFLGDGGAYFLGFMLAIFGIILSARHEEISVWYPLAALAYPTIETFVTIDRRIKRKRKYGIPFFEAEKVHLHTLKFRRRTKDNAAASRRLLLFHFYINILAFMVHQYVFALIALFVIVYIVYLGKYRKVIRFGKF